jgi:hypothetical protein
MDGSSPNLSKIVENQTSIAQLIQNWRTALAESPAFKTENLDELEGHLRDSMAVLQQKGLTESESFWVGAKRIGHGDLVSEFAKVNAQHVWLQRALWMVLGIQLWGLIRGLVGGIVQTGSFLAAHILGYDLAGKGRALPAVLICLASLVTLLCFLKLAWLIMKKVEPNISQWSSGILFSKGKLTFAFLVCLLLLLVQPAFSLLSVRLLISYFSMNEFAEFQRINSFSGIAFFVLQCLGLLAATFFLARKVLRNPSVIQPCA